MLRTTILNVVSRRSPQARNGLEELLDCVQDGMPGCVTCLSPEALGSWTPLILEEE